MASHRLSLSLGRDGLLSQLANTADGIPLRCANKTDELELPEHNLSARNGKRTYELVRWVLPLTTPSRSSPHDLFPCSPLPLSIELFCIHRGVRTGGVVRPRPYPTADSL